MVSPWDRYSEIERLGVSEVDILPLLLWWESSNNSIYSLYFVHFESRPVSHR